jgi:hypothetical protein
MSSQLPMRTRWHRAAAPAAVLALTLGLAACGESDEDEDAATPTTQAPSASPSTEPAGGSGNLSAFCGAVIDFDASFASGGPEGPDPARIQAALEEVQTTAPVDVASDVDRFATLTQEAFSGGAEGDGPPPPEVEEVDARIDEYVLANCDFAEVEVTGSEYTYEGVPSTLEAGPTAFDFTNAGGEEHELIVFRINDDVTASVQELLALPEEEAIPMVQIKGFAMAAPAESDQAFVDLEPGRYAGVCFFPVGSTPEAIAAAEGSGQELDGPPHFTQGMVAEFTVE